MTYNICITINLNYTVRFFYCGHMGFLEMVKVAGSSFIFFLGHIYYGLAFLVHIVARTLSDLTIRDQLVVTPGGS